ncbi:type VI secretion system tip protein VgrG [Pedobacter sandarakinus]|uniref:type VI secretion system tip protein VgrG n=1 Tax=Pedobacter sandarakinus TaxID=353156 RepID=UPI002247A73D|nr:type VI secretion system tip protein VgrG [Pedobacter sandarakinus]MCX2574540.1 type VI secretion system tip protein VgrG [Pedobacter sandarakinus]
MPQPTGLQGFDITINGQALPSSVGILEISVSNVVNSIPKAKLVLMDGNAAAQTFDLSSGDLFVPGAEITIAAGYDGQTHQIFAGLILSQTLKVDEGGSNLEIECRDQTIKLTAGRKNKIWEDTTDGDIISELLAARNIADDISSLQLQHKQIVQYNCSDWDFIITRTELNGALLIVDLGKVIVGIPDFNQSVMATYTYGTDIYDFEAQMDARTQYPEAAMHSWNYTDQEVRSETASSSMPVIQGNLSGEDLADAIGWDNNNSFHSGQLSEPESVAWAEAQLFRSRLNRITGSLRVLGNAELKPGLMIEILGFGDRFNGKCLVTGILHTFTGEAAWYTHIQFGLNKDLHAYKFDDIIEKQASGIIPPVNGLQIGVVTQLESDPEGESRIKVRLPLVAQNGEGIWARLSGIDAGNNRGWVWNPEIDDEVIIGFINDDPRDAIILGSLYSSKHPPHLALKDENFLKGLQTKSEMKITFDDDKKILRIETPAGNEVILDEEAKKIMIADQHGNKIETGDGGIVIESIKDITLKASGDIKIAGVNVSGKASAQLGLVGDGGAEFSSSAIVKVKGSMVQIN